MTLFLSLPLQVHLLYGRPQMGVFQLKILMILIRLRDCLKVIPANFEKMPICYLRAAQDADNPFTFNGIVPPKGFVSK